MDYKTFFKFLHEVREPRNYVEIGIRAGSSLTLAKCLSIGIDPGYRITSEIVQPVKLFKETSDAFFEKYSLRNELYGQDVDLAFIDGMHLAEYALRDFLNLEKYCSRESLIVFDDVLPRNNKEAARTSTGGDWTGDVYKAILFLLEFRKDLKITVLQTQPTGLAVVSNLNPAFPSGAELVANLNQKAKDPSGGGFPQPSDRGAFLKHFPIKKELDFLYEELARQRNQ